MIYEEPRYLPGGDRYMLIEFGNEMNLELNFMGQGLAKAIAEHKTKGVIETAPCFASMLVHYEPDDIGFDDLKNEMAALIAELGSSDAIELPSRLFYFPTVYLDPWTKAAVDDYCEKIAKKPWDPQFIADENELKDVTQFVRVHSGTEYWVASLGFWPGLPFMMALDPRSVITAPKYNPPRTWTPKGTIGHGGAITCIYPDRTPGGYQIFARTPMPIWDREQRLHAFKDSLALFRPGDRVRFVPIEREEYDYVDGKVQDGTYNHNLVEYQRFSIREYHAWLKSIDTDERM
jgi:KipI family sensor histidine kinase inhibitor